MRFDLEKYNEEQLEAQIRSLRPGDSVTLQGSGASLTAQPGNVRLFKLGVPRNTAKQARVPLTSMRSAKAATELLVNSHKAILEQRSFEEDTRDGIANPSLVVEECPRCLGSGTWGDFTCDTCGGRGISRVQ